MVKIKNEQQYEKALERVEELLRIVGNDTPESDKNFVELDLLSELVADYEEENYPVYTPTLSESIRLRMAEMNLTQKALSELLGVSTSRISEYMTGKSEPTLKIARAIHEKLNIDANIILGSGT
jgi:HTH-type transcriptional regulator/antitoxin HigA